MAHFVAELHTCLQYILYLNEVDTTVVINKIYNKADKFICIEKDIISELFGANVRMSTLNIVKCEKIRVTRLWFRNQEVPIINIYFFLPKMHFIDNKTQYQKRTK